MTEQPSRPYATPAALRQALTHRLAAAAAESPWPLADLQRQFAYDRLLHRLYLLDSGWILKGATALLARQISARHTIDLDIYRAATRAEAERDLRTAAAIDAATGSNSKSVRVARSPRKAQPARAFQPPPASATPFGRASTLISSAKRSG